MAIAILVGVAALLGVACGALGWSYARKVAGATAPDLGALVIALKKLPEEERLRALSSRSRPGSWEQRLAGEALAAPDDAAKIAAANEALDDIDHVLSAGAAWPKTAVRIAFFGGLLLGIVTFLVARELRWALLVVGIDAVAALTCVEAGRAARRGAEAQRRSIDALIAVTMGRLVEATTQEPERRSRRRGARR